MRTKTDKQQIEYVQLSALTPYARNSRTHSPEQVKRIAASIREFGFTNPVLIDADGTIIAGHGRVLAAQHTIHWRGFRAGCAVVRIHMPVQTVSSKIFAHIQMV
jgi:hypothetical protein